MTLDAARAVIAGAIGERIFPAAVAEVGDRRACLWREAFGTLTFDAESPSVDDNTIFDLASLTKPIATTTLTMQMVARGDLTLDAPLSVFFDEWRGADREASTVRDLLEHASGLPARLVDQAPEGRREFVHEICAIRLESPLRAAAVYSDLGFILLGFLVEDRGGAPLDDQFDRLLRLNGIVGRESSIAAADESETGLLHFGVPPELRQNTAPTWPMNDDRRRGRLLAGEVHDTYAAALGGSAGHAGLFGTAASVGRFARSILKATASDRTLGGAFSPASVALATTKSTVPGSSRALGWDTMLPSSSCGALLSPAAFGHVGFTGTSLWIDPVLDRYFVLLTNRACRGGTLDQMRRVRRAFHDAVATLG